MIEIRFLRLPHAEGLPLPARQSAEAAGLDLAAAVAEDAPLHLAVGERALVPTGFALELPVGFEGQIRPRSGLALKHGVTVLNAPGTIDSDYRGEIGVLLINHGDESYVVRRGARIGQLVVSRIENVVLTEARNLKGTLRSTKGFGSTDMTGPSRAGER